MVDDCDGDGVLLLMLIDCMRLSLWWSLLLLTIPSYYKVTGNSTWCINY